MKRSLLIVCIMIFCLLVCGCTASNQNALPSGKYVAIEEEVRDDGTFVSGEMLSIPDAVPYPLFFYDPNNTPSGYPADYPQKNESLKILLGTHHVDSTPEYLKGDLTVSGVYGFPYLLHPNLTIIGVDKNGTIEFVFGNEPIELKINSAWRSPVISTRLATINRTAYDTNYSYVVNYSTTYVIENKGLFNK